MQAWKQWKILAFYDSTGKAYLFQEHGVAHWWVHFGIFKKKAYSLSLDAALCKAHEDIMLIA